MSLPTTRPTLLSRMRKGDDDLTDTQIARRHGLTLHQLRYARKKARDSLCQRWEKDL